MITTTDTTGLEWVTNSDDVRRDGAQSRYEAAIWNTTPWNEHVRWFFGFIIGPPQPTDACSVNDLTAMGYVGLWRKPGVDFTDEGLLEQAEGKP